MALKDHITTCKTNWELYVRSASQSSNSLSSVIPTKPLARNATCEPCLLGYYKTKTCWHNHLTIRCPWYVTESSDKWLSTVSRFGPDTGEFPAPLTHRMIVSIGERFRRRVEVTRCDAMIRGLKGIHVGGWNSAVWPLRAAFKGWLRYSSALLPKCVVWAMSGDGLQKSAGRGKV